MRVPGLPGDPLWLLGVPDVARGNGTALLLGPFGFAVWR